MWYYERQIALSLLNKGPVPGTGTGVLYCIRYSNMLVASFLKRSLHVSLVTSNNYDQPIPTHFVNGGIPVRWFWRMSYHLVVSRLVVSTQFKEICLNRNIATAKVRLGLNTQHLVRILTKSLTLIGDGVRCPVSGVWCPTSLRLLIGRINISFTRKTFKEYFLY